MIAAQPASAERSGGPLERRSGTGWQDVDALGYAGAVTRAIAFALDVLLIVTAALAVTGAVALIFAVFRITGKHDPVLLAIGAAAFVVWVITYFVACWTTTGQTPGNRMMHTRVVRLDGVPLRPRQAFIRLAGMALSLPLFWGYWPILTSPRRRGVPDGIAGTVVVVVDGAREAEKL